MEKATETLKQAECLNHDLAFCVKRLVKFFSYFWSCEFLGHSWRPSYHNAVWGGTKLKFIACHCRRCNKGFPELITTLKKREAFSYGTFEEKYY